MSAGTPHKGHKHTKRCAGTHRTVNRRVRPIARNMLRGNAVLRSDPTRTLTIRNNFVREARRRFRQVQRLITESVVTNDALGLVERPRTILQGLQAEALPPKAFEFATNPQKAQQFMEWLAHVDDLTILEIPEGQTRRVVGNVAWANTHIESAHKQGIKRARQEMKKAKLPAGVIGPTDPGSISAAFLTPVHADRAGLIFTRTYSDLKGITDQMEADISRVLAQGLAEGRGPRDIARALNHQIESTGQTLAITDSAGRRIKAIQRATVLARTEVIRAHHIATINEYREAGVEGVIVQAEFSTAGDDRVCPQCAGLEGDVFTLDAAEGIIPVHAQCRCIMIPVNFKFAPRTTAGGTLIGIGNRVLPRNIYLVRRRKRALQGALV